ncbi:ATP-binding protein [uncultured Clostridium sp.]|uniref:AAA family ATPase n=1 Tax=uncultured Clostridium sp. TaxID=59620 RepID=UPI00258F91E3|nr:ATP-binding protein [uncultured Clostridium sp.]
MEKFVDREEEMMTLQSEYERPGSSLVILYGRRRVGKTALISEFIKGKNALFFLASEESEAQNRTAFKEKAADFTGNELLRQFDAKSWDILFQTIMQTPFQEKPIIVIDEFQYIGKSNPAFPSIFQRIWEEQLKDRSVMVILCGSLISMMESQTLSYSSPLYGRRTAQIRLKQIPFRYYHEFFPDKSPRELVEYYSVTGGVPKYIELFSESDDIYHAIQKNILNRSGYLYDEPHFLLQQEVSEIGNYFSVIRAIAAGNSKLSAISTVLEVKSTSLTKYLKTLIDLDILEREVPVTEENPEKSKKGLYKIKDNYLRFWFAFIYPNMSFIESGNSAIVLDKIRKSMVSGHTAFVYEDVCREQMWKLNANGAWPFHFSKLGRWWDSRNEIDIAAIDPDGSNLILGECKFWQEPVGSNILYALEQKAATVEWRKDRRHTWLILFSAAGFTDELKDIAKSRSDLILAEH